MKWLKWFFSDVLAPVIFACGCIFIIIDWLAGRPSTIEPMQICVIGIGVRVLFMEPEPRQRL